MPKGAGPEWRGASTFGSGLDQKGMMRDEQRRAGWRDGFVQRGNGCVLDRQRGFGKHQKYESGGRRIADGRDHRRGVGGN